MPSPLNSSAGSRLDTEPSLRLKLTSIDPDITPLSLSMIGLIFNVCLSTFSFKPKHSLYSDLMALTAVFFNTEYVVFL